MKLRYKNYIGSIGYSEEDDIFWGKVLGIGSVILYEGSSIAEAKEDFKGAVDDYINLCRELDQEPEVSHY